MSAVLLEVTFVIVMFAEIVCGGADGLKVAQIHISVVTVSADGCYGSTLGHWLFLDSVSDACKMTAGDGTNFQQ